MKGGAIIILAAVVCVHADIYLHNPRGSNNRLDEAKRDRNNANRMFDSQNNNRGGYNVGSLYYYTGSILSMEWTNQHSCGDQNNHCEQILQYMCDDRIRDGATTQTIPDNPANCENYDCNTDIEFGMHENFDYYLDCRLRQRNTGLFIADRNLRGDTAVYTRQNENGNRRGYECPEERDYYPYWHPTPWRDIAIFTNDATRCPYYQTQSQNVKSRFACVLPSGVLTPDIVRSNQVFIPNTQEECENIETNGTWTEFPPDPRLSAPECIETHWSRDNHLGNTVGGYPINYNWTVPDITHEHCVLRIRYNISTAEYDGWDGSINSGIERVRNIEVLDGATENGVADLNNEVISELSDVYTQFGFDTEEARERGYVFRQNPVVKVFPDANGNANNFGLQLAINTNQFGRTFQDRSHTFAIRQRPDDLEGVTIHNLNVRGKRGNIVQVYPGVEYDFVPNVLVMGSEDYLHIQWTGSNTNPNNNDGQGRAGTDRSNVILLRPPNYEEGNGMATEDSTAYGHWGNSYPAHFEYDNLTFLGFSREDNEFLATLVNLQLGGEMSELDDAGTYYDLGPRMVTQVGTYYYMCTRNNNFSNRSQKGKIIVQANPLALKRIGWSGGSVELNGHELEFQQATLLEASEYRLDEYSDPDMAEEMTGVDEPAGQTVSSFILVTPTGQFPGYDEENAQPATIGIPVDKSISSENIRIMRANAASNWDFVHLDTRIIDDMAYADTNSGGVFVANAELNAGFIAGVVIAAFVLLVIAIAVGGVVIYFLVRRDKWQKTKENARKMKQKVTRSFAKQV